MVEFKSPKQRSGELEKSRRDGKQKPMERISDLRPFPNNKEFWSQAVLSEGLRETIWQRIMREGHSVREVSAKLGVEMARVGAVVRLMEIEKEWQRIVSLTHRHGVSSHIASMMIVKNSISLEDNYMVMKFTHASLSETFPLRFYWFKLKSL